MVDNKHSPKVSVIIPVYNCEEYLQRCLDSIYQQTFEDYEIITINDGSKDSSLDILEKNAKNHSEITVIDQTNHGQGYARNRALEIARGEYILFVDSDDYIDPLTLELTLNRAERDKSDIVHFDWKFSSLLPGRPNAYLYLNKEPFSYKGMLIGDECDELLQLWNFFTVNNLYRKSFLDKEKVRYGEGYLYEDVIFMVLAANRASAISILQSPLYIVQRNVASSTRSGYFDDRHYTSFVRAMRDSIEELKPRTKYTAYYMAKYFQTKFIFYYKKRTPKHHRADFLKNYVDLMGGLDIVIPDNSGPERILRTCLKYNIFQDKKYRLLHSLVMYKTIILPGKDKAKGYAKALKQSLRKSNDLYRKELEKPIIKGSIVMLGFDYRYTGNSRYLFEKLIKDSRYAARDIRFITDDELVDSAYRVATGSDEYFKWIARAETIIAESWVPGNIKKREDAIILQLWHGTPLKKLLFDSSESEMMKRNEKYKIGKHWNLMRWDYLVADSNVAVRKFRSAFLFPEKRILQTGYPRVEYLIENKKNKELKNSIRDKLGLGGELKNKKLVLYAPTWRDYNYKIPVDEQDFDYLLDINKLASSLGDEYIVLYRDHHFLSSIQQEIHENCIDVAAYEAQELLLITNHVITDYSSIMFDAFAIDTPITLYVNDFDKYQESRGVYEDIWEDIRHLSTDSLDELTQRIKDNVIVKKDNKLSEYTYKKRVSLIDFINDLDLSKINRDW